MTDAARIADAKSAGRNPWTLGVEQPTEDTVVLRLAGRWRLENALPGPDEVWRRLDAHSTIRRLRFDTEGVAGWDSGLLVFLGKIIGESDRRRIECDRSGLPDGVRRLLALAAAVPERKDARQGGRRPSWLAYLGNEAMAAAGRAPRLPLPLKTGPSGVSKPSLVEALVLVATLRAVARLDVTRREALSTVVAGEEQMAVRVLAPPPRVRN